MWRPRDYDEAMRVVSAAVVLVLAGCAGHRPPEIAQARMLAGRAHAPTPCAPAARPETTEPRVEAEGKLHVESVRGAARLWTDASDEVAWSNSGARVAVGGYGTVSVWSVYDSSLISVLRVPGNPHANKKLEWSTDDRTILVTQRPFESLEEHAVVVVEGDGANLGSLQFQPVLRFGLTGPTSLTLARHGELEIALLAARDFEQFFLGGARDGLTGSLMLRTADACFELGPGHSTDLFTFSADGASLFAVQARDGRLRLSERSTRDGRVIRSWEAEGAGSAVVMPALDRVFLLVSGGVEIVDWTTGVLRAAMTGPAVSDALSSGHVFYRTAHQERPGGTNGTVIASKTGDFLLGESRFSGGGISIWYVPATGVSRRIQIDDTIERIALSPDELRFAVGRSDGVVELRERASGAQRWSTEEATPITALAFSDDGELIAAGARDGSVRILSAATGAVHGRLALGIDRASVLSWAGPTTLVVDTRFGRVVTVRVER
ncbi:MAG: WD40 repeat domain-containing protein [Kofleriaceae bacterium]